MASSYIVWYLFLAGIGSGAFLIAGIVDLLLRFKESEALEEMASLTDRGLLLGPLAVALGSLFLVLDLGVPSRALLIFFSGELTILSIGSWSIILFVGCALGALIIGRMFDGAVSEKVELVLHCAAILFAILVMTYSGLYLSAYKSVPFLNTPFVPFVFIASAISSGLAFLCATSLFTRPFNEPFYGARWFIRLDAPVIAVEALLITIFLIVSFLQDEVERTSVEMLLTGNLSVLFWAGVVAAGMMLPVIAEIASMKTFNYPILAFGSCGSLVGSLYLRYSLLLAATRFSLACMTPMQFWWG